jgi:phosphonoacetate hydrolase
MKTSRDGPEIEVNGRTYAWPADPVVVVCIDGSEPGYEGSDSGGYIERAIAAGSMPFLGAALKTGTNRLADCVVPSFTNPNNISIVTGVPPAVHGICGNYFYDREADAEVMMNDPRFLRAGTILEAFQKAGAKVGAVTAKDKLRGLLGNGLTFGASGSFCFSAEKADEASLAEHGIEDVPEVAGLPVPSVYSADLSEFVLAAGVKLMETLRPAILYLSTTDYVQHKHAPGSADANSFYRMMDDYFAQLDALGATLALTADHGMKAKHDAKGDPDVIYLQALMDDWLGEAAARVICPITDPYVVHHGALGGFATIYLPAGADAVDVVSRLTTLDGVECALPRSEGCRRFELPEDRVGDVIVVSTRNKVLGTRPDRHDLSGLTQPLRSHGGLSEQRVPLLLNRPTPALAPARRLRNFDVFEVALNHAEGGHG